MDKQNGSTGYVPLDESGQVSPEQPEIQINIDTLDEPTALFIDKPAKIVQRWKPPEDNANLALLASFLCSPCAFMAIIYYDQAKEQAANGELSLANASVQNARHWLACSVALGFCLWTVCVVFPLAYMFYAK